MKDLTAVEMILLLDGGVSPKLVQAAMGHTSMGTTLKYIGFVKPKDSITGKLPY